MTPWLEKSLEDYIVAHPDKLSEQIFQTPNDYEFSFLGRQVRCVYGIIDALFWARSEQFSYVVVVECKAKHERGLAVEQLTRYQGAISHARVYDNAPDDAWPIFAEDGRGWAWRIKLQTIPVIVAPSFSNHLLSTFEGVLITAEYKAGEFELTRLLDRLDTYGQEDLDDTLAPVIKRAQIDAKSEHIKDKLGRCAPSLYRYLAN